LTSSCEAGTLTHLTSFYVPEPNLIFANKRRFKDPKGGLYLYGPYGRYADGKEFSLTANVGIIGTSKSIGNTLDFFDKIHNRVPAMSVGGIDFPGLGLDGRIRFDIKFDEQWQETITTQDLEECRKQEKRTDRALSALELIEDKLESLQQKEPSPDVVFIIIPMKIIGMCKLSGQVGLKITLAHRRFGSVPTKEQVKGDYDFHNIIKVIGMKHYLPTQVILPTTLDLERKIGVQDLATRAWNLTVATYYKSKGVPWKLTELEPGTCYAGISFYRELDPNGKQSMRASVAQIFLHTGESLVLRGDPFEWPEFDRHPHLNEEQSSALLVKIKTAYIKTHSERPKRLVIHKSSVFTEEEKRGFLGNAQAVKQTDLITLTRSGFSWHREGTYPIVRGTVIKSLGPEFYIFTLGYIPQLRTFPKPGVPVPVRVRPANLDSPERKMCKEILSLTRLNWNNADFCDQMPITLLASGRIGAILCEARAREIETSHEYRFYM